MKLSEELDPIKNKVRLETSPAQWHTHLTRSEKERAQSR